MRARKFTALLALGGTACTTMRVQTAPTPEVVGTKALEKARFRLTDGTALDIHQPALNGDSIVGFTQPASVATRKRVAVATADVVSVSVPKFSVGRTILGLTATVVGIAIIAGLSATNSTPQQQSCEPTTAAQHAPQPA